MDERRDSGEFYPGGDRRGGDPIDLTFDDAVTPTSARAVKSSGIWAAVWGTLAAVPTGFASLYDWCVAKLKAKQDALSDAQLANIEDVEDKADASVVNAALASVGDGFTTWSITPATTPGGDAIWLTYQGGGWIPMAGDPAMPVGMAKIAAADALSLSWAEGTEAAYAITATRSRTATWTLAIGKYEKPVTGIPASDLAQAVQTALSEIPGKAAAADLRYRIVEETIVMGCVSLADRTESRVTPTETYQYLYMYLPPRIEGRTRDLIIDFDNSANLFETGLDFASNHNMYIDSGDDPYLLAVADGDDLAELTTVAAGARARFYISETAQTATPTGGTEAVPVISLQRLTVVVGGA